MSFACLTCGQPFARTTFSGPGPNAGSGSSALWWALGGFVALCFVLIVVAGGVFLYSQGVFDEAPAPKRGPVAAPVIVTAAPPPTTPSAAPSAAPPAVARASLSNEERDELPGEYTCSIDDTAPFRCRIANNTLEKLEGSQRFRGPISKVSGGNLSFSGTFFCPIGACTHPVATTFVRQSPGRYVGRFGPNSVPGGGPGNERVVLTKVR